MEVTGELRRMIHQAAPTHELRAWLRRAGVKALREAGVLLATKGQSSLEEVLRATHADSDEAPNQGTLKARAAA